MTYRELWNLKNNNYQAGDKVWDYNQYPTEVLELQNASIDQ